MDFDYKILGLENRDMRVYEALWKLEKGSIRAIADETGMNRGTVHEVIKKLTSYGLVTFTVIGKQRRYKAADPATFAAIVRERQEHLERAEKGAESYAAKLSQQQEHHAIGDFAAFYEGDEGVAVILRDVLNTMSTQKDKKYHVVSSRAVSVFLYNNFPSFTRQRIKQSIFVQVIAVGEPTTEPIVLAERQTLPSDQNIPAHGYTIIYADKTAFIALNEQNVPFGIVIDNAGVANLERLRFTRLWEYLKKSDSYSSPKT